MSIDRITAIQKLVGGAVSRLADEITYQDGQTPPTEAEIEAEVIRLQAEFDAQAYARERRPLYPAIGDQLDDLYHAGVFSAEMTATLKKVKDDNPK